MKQQHIKDIIRFAWREDLQEETLELIIEDLIHHHECDPAFQSGYNSCLEDIRQHYGKEILDPRKKLF